MKNKTEPINIVLASDQTYYIGLWVTLVSLLSNTKTKSVINFFIFDGGINKKSKIKLLKKLKEINKNISISYLEPQLGTFKNFNVMYDKPSGSLIYSSVIVPESLNNLDKAIYLDVDLLILMDIELLWNTKMDGKPIAAVIDYFPDYTTYNDIQNPSKYSIDLNSSYYNTGVLLYDIKALNQFNFTKKCINYLNNEDKKNYTLHDQSAINVVMNNNFHTLDNNFNFLNGFLLKKTYRENLAAELDFLNHQQYIFHFTTMKYWNHYISDFHCELFYFFLRKYKYHDKFKAYNNPLKFKIKLSIKKILISINYKGILNVFFSSKTALIEIEKADFIKKNKRQMYRRFHELS